MILSYSNKGGSIPPSATKPKKVLIMLKVYNVKVYDLEESLIASGYAMKTEPVEDFDKLDVLQGIERGKKLVNASKVGDVHCHDNFLTGIRVSFDVVYPQYWSMEAQRYHWFDIVTSSSKMHRLDKMDLDVACNEYVDDEIKDRFRTFIELYKANPCQATWMNLISNCPMGLELFMRVSTNYKQLQTIYFQRRYHKNIDWRVFCEWIETLPYFNELIKGKSNEKKTMSV